MSHRAGQIKALIVCSTFLLFYPGFFNTGHAVKSITEQILQQTSNRIYGKVTEVIHGAGYTYAEVDTGTEKVWAAASVSPIEVGDMISFSTEMPMENFHSKSMDRDFPLIYFVSKFNTNDSGSTGASTVTTRPHRKTRASATAAVVEGVDKIEGGNTIAELYKEKQTLDGKEVRVRGKVTRFTAGVMGKNWLHIRDSSTLEDLTITTDSEAAVDAVVVIEGKLALDKDFGYGYVYPLIVEDASIIKE